MNACSESDKQDEPAWKVVSGQIIWADITKNTILREAFIKKNVTFVTLGSDPPYFPESVKKQKKSLLKGNIKSCSCKG